MNRRIICTVGTSLLTNPDRPWAGWKRNQPLPQIDEIVTWLATADPRKASAETNTLSHLEVDEGDILAFLHSDTPEGRLCGEALAQYYERRVGSASTYPIEQLGYGAKPFTRGLKGLVNCVLKHWQEANKLGQRPILAATGGFKAEIAMLNLLGALLSVEVVYLHELHGELVRLPRLPLSWDEEFVLNHESFFHWIDEEPRRSEEVEERLKAAPELRFLVEDDDEGHTMLSAAGDLLFKAAKERRAMGPRAEWPDADPRPPDEKNKVSEVPHHRPEGWERYVDRLCRIDCVSLVRVDPGATHSQKVRVLDPDKGILAVRYEKSGSALSLVVETTARGSAQCELVKAYIENRR